MTAGQLSWIKQRQREHQQLFGAPLLIDFNKMNGVSSPKYFDEKIVNDWINNYVKINNIDLNIVKNNKLCNKYCKEYKFIKEFALFIKQNNINYAKAAEMIGKERTTLRHHIYKL